MVSTMLKHSTVQKLVYGSYRYQHTEDMCPVIAYCVTEFQSVFHGLIFWRLFIGPVKQKISVKFRIFLSISLNMCFGYSKEPSH